VRVPGKTLRSSPAQALGCGHAGGRLGLPDLPGARASRQETTMAKGQKKSNKEVRKPKADKKTPPVSVSPFIVTPGKK